MGAIEKKRFRRGEVVFHQGETSTEMYHVLSGRVGISIPKADGDLLLAELGPGSLFGEMALINGPPRTATATALEEVEVNVIPEALFRQNATGLPEWALAIARVLADRLKNTTLSLDKMLYEESHTVKTPGSPSPSSISIVPKSLEIAYYPESDAHRLYLSGVLDPPGLEELMNQVNNLRRHRITPIILSFSNVVDVQRRALDAVVDLAKNSTDATGRIQLENVQFIADKLQKHEGIQSILITSQAPVRRVGYGEYLVRQGEVGNEMYVVKTGAFTISRQVKDKEVILWTAEEGDVIGEMALISGKVRSASVLAKKSSQVQVINLTEFRKNAYHIPRWFMNLIESLVNRLRETNAKLDAFVTGSLHPTTIADLLTLELYENFKEPGTCRMSGALTHSTLTDLKTYVRQRLKQGVRSFTWDVTQLQSVDQEAVKFVVGFHRYLLNIRGKLTINGSASMQFPVEL